MAGPAVLGIYAVASKFAELIKVLGMALTTSSTRAITQEGRETATVRARRLIPRRALLTAATILPLWLAAGFVIPVFYGPISRPPSCRRRSSSLGLALEGVGGVMTGYLYGVGRPGLNSWAMGVGLVVTLLLDLLLIPPFGAAGAAAASAVAYLATRSPVCFYWRLSRARSALAWEDRLVEAGAQRR